MSSLAERVRGDDPDETDGRRLYRAWSDGLARAQLAMAARRVTLREAAALEAKETP